MNQKRQSLSPNRRSYYDELCLCMLMSAVIRFQHWHYNETFFKQICKKWKKIFYFE